MKELFEKYFQKQGYIFVAGLKILVRIKDIKKSYGRPRFLVSPIAGEGEVWVELVALAV